MAQTIAQACDSLGVSYEIWRKHIEPEVRIVRLGSRKLVPVRELERWLSNHAEALI
jgi:hypothetical protein